MNRDLSHNHAVTLLELIVAMVLFSMIILYFSALEQIGRRTTFLAERKAQVQNEAIFVLEHMRQQLIKTIGYADMIYSGISVNPLYIVEKGGGKRKLLKYWTDGNLNGRWDTNDTVGCYAARDGNNQVVFYNNDNTNYSGNSCGGGAEVLSSRIVSFSTTPPAIQRSPFDLTSNYITLTVTACWDPSEANGTCGDEKADNPQVTMQTTVAMPSVSVH